jgi:AAA domain/S1 RNA binding domain
MKGTAPYRDAERQFYDACRTLPADWHVLYNVHWINGSGANSVEGECDFIIIGPEIGMIVVEVKGGGVGRDSNGWFSIDRERKRHRIKDPAPQSQTNRFAVLSYLHGTSVSTIISRTPSTHMVCFPHVQRRRIPPLPELPADLLLDSDDLPQLSQHLLTGARFFNNRRFDTLSSADCKALANALLPQFEAPGRWSSRIWEQKFAIDVLTDEQRSTLDSLTDNKNLSLTGPAGSGKTIAAILCAKRFIKANSSVLVIVPSKALQGYYSSVLGTALATVVLPVQVPEQLSQRWNCLIIDEAQDVSDDLIAEAERYCDRSGCSLIIAHDSNQRLVRERSEPGQRFTRVRMRKVLRNTNQIGTLSTRFYLNKALEPEIVGPSGNPVKEIIVANATDIPIKVAEFVVGLTEHEGFAFRDIVVLFGRSSGKFIRKGGISYSGVSYRNAVSVWGEGCDDARCVACSNILAFRGMESPVVILCEIDDLLEGELIEHCYVGTSRAQLVLGIVGLPGTLERIRNIDLEPVADRRERQASRDTRRRQDTQKVAHLVSPGCLCLATVTGVAGFGVFFRLPGARYDGLLHRSQITRDPALDLTALFQNGQKHTVRISSIDERKGRINLELPDGDIGRFRRTASH